MITMERYVSSKNIYQAGNITSIPISIIKKKERKKPRVMSHYLNEGRW